MKRVLTLTFLLAACGNSKFDVGINAGPAGADVGRMAASEVRQSRVAKDRRVDVRIAAMRTMVQNSATPKDIVASVDSMIDDEAVGVVISRFLDQELINESQKLHAHHVPVLSTTPLPEGVAAAQGPIFSFVPGYTQQAAFLAKQAEPSDKIGIVYIDDYYGSTLTTEITSALAARGLKVADARKYEQSWDEPRMVALGTDMQSVTHPTLVYFIGRAPSLELVWQPFREKLDNVRVIGSDLVESSAIYDNPEGIFTGLKYVRYFDPKSPDPRMKDLHDRFALWIGRGEMTGEAVMVYDAMLMTGEALRSGARTREQIRQYFASLGRSRPAFKGVEGPVSFTNNGEAGRAFELAEVTDHGVVNADSVKVGQQ